MVSGDSHTSVNDKRDDFRFPIVNVPCLNGDVSRLPSYGIYICRLICFAWCYTSNFSFPFKKDKSPLHCCHRLTDFYHKLRKIFGNFLDTNLNLCQRLVQYCFKNKWQRESPSRFTMFPYTKFGGSVAQMISSPREQNTGWLNFRGVPIFVVFVEGLIHEF